MEEKTSKNPYDKQDLSTPESRARLDEIDPNIFNINEALGIDAHQVLMRFAGVLPSMIAERIAAADPMQYGESFNAHIMSGDIVAYIEKNFTYRELSFIAMDIIAKTSVDMGSFKMEMGKGVVSAKPSFMSQKEVKGKA